MSLALTAYIAVVLLVDAMKLGQLGIVVGRPEHPVYPYRGSIHKQRPLMIVLMIVTGFLIALGGFDLLRFPH